MRQHLTRFEAALCCAMGLLTAVACKGPTQGGPAQMGGPGAPSGVAGGSADGGPQGQPLPEDPTQSSSYRPFGQDPVSWLDAKAQVELARSTQPNQVPLPWREVTPTAVVDAKAKDPNAKNGESGHEWTAEVLLAGRQQVFAGDTPLAKVRCRADPAELCTTDGLRAPTGKQTLDFDPGDLDESGHLRWLTAAVGVQGWSGKTVQILVDRRMGAGAVLQLRDTLLAAGAQPQLVSATLMGQMGVLLPEPGTQPVEVAFAATPAEALPAGGASSADLDTAAGRVPRDMTAVVAQVLRNGVHLEFQRPDPLPPVTPELLGNIVESLNVWAERARTASPALHLATVVADPDAPWEEVVRVIDALRDTCARTAKGTPCHDQRLLFSHIELRIRESAPAPTPPAPGTGPAPAPGAKPPEPM